MTVTGTPPTPRSVWVYEAVDISMALPYMLLVRIVVAKIKDRRRLQYILKDPPLRPEVEGWNCVWWVQEALGNACRDPSAIELRTELGVHEGHCYVVCREEKSRASI